MATPSSLFMCLVASCPWDIAQATSQGLWILLGVLLLASHLGWFHRQPCFLVSSRMQHPPASAVLKPFKDQSIVETWGLGLRPLCAISFLLKVLSLVCQQHRCPKLCPPAFPAAHSTAGHSTAAISVGVEPWILDGPLMEFDVPVVSLLCHLVLPEVSHFALCPRAVVGLCRQSRLVGSLAWLPKSPPHGHSFLAWVRVGGGARGSNDHPYPTLPSAEWNLWKPCPR